MELGARIADQVTVGGEVFAGQQLELESGAPERMVVLKAEHRVRGRVTDAMTGKPIQAFTVVVVHVPEKNDFMVVDPYEVAHGKDGQLDYLAEISEYPIRLRISAMRYRTQDGPIFRIGDDNAELRISACSRARRSRAASLMPPAARAQRSRRAGNADARGESLAKCAASKSRPRTLRGGSRFPTPANRGASWCNLMAASRLAISRPISMTPEH